MIIALVISTIGIIISLWGIYFDEPILMGLGGGIVYVMLIEFFVEYLDKEKGDKDAVK